MDAEKNKKLQQYAVALTEQAKEEERTGKTEEAMKHYLKLVDVFLVLAAEAQDHNTWAQYIRQAEAYQTRTRTLMSGGQQSTNKNHAHEDGIENNETLQHTVNPLKKILKPFQRNEDEVHENKVPVAPQTPSVSQLRPANVAPETASVETYQRVLSENKLLRDKIMTLTKEKDDRISLLDKRCQELESRISEMVPQADYDELQTELCNAIPKMEYDRIKAELLNSVPKTHYDDLLNRIAEMVPRQAYLDAERRSMALEEMIKNSIPKKVIEDLASEVSMLGVLSSVPLEKTPETKEELEIASTISEDEA